MVFELANRMRGLPEQFFAGLSSSVAARIANGYDVINLGQGNPDLPTPKHIVEALREAALDPITHRYSPFTGLPQLKEAVAEFYRLEYGVSLDPHREVAVLFGGKTGLVELSQIYLNHGDKALVPDPGYPDYMSGIALAGGEMITVPLREENGFLPDLDEVKKMALDRVKLWFVNYPNNPTGRSAPDSFYPELIEVATKNRILVMHDFAYGAISFDGERPASILQFDGAKETSVELYTLSKTYNMAGWRVAFAVGNEHVIKDINLLQDHYYVSLFGAIQRAAAKALTGPQDCVDELRQTYERRRNALHDELDRLGWTFTRPQGSFFSWLRVPKGTTSASFAHELLYGADVAVAPGVGFGKQGDSYVRVGLLTQEEKLVEAAQRMAEVYRKYSR